MASTPTIEQVINKGFCIGCGACGVISPQFKVEDASNGEARVLKAPADRTLLDAASKVCPMGSAPDEDELADRFLPSASGYSDGIGRFIDLYAGYSVAERPTGGSGGLTRWLLAKLLSTREVDFVVQVDRKLEGAGSDQDLFFYEIHTDAGSYLSHTSTSAYYPITLDKLFEKIMTTPGRCAITALPCFSRAIRSVALTNPLFESKVALVSGTICGGLKSRRYAQYLALQMGVGPAELDRINFRGKAQAERAKEKCVEVWRESSPEESPDASKRVQALKGTDYGLGYFKPKGCDYCDDVLAETADVAFGDAWIKPYIDDRQGTNVVVIRNQRVAEIFRDAAATGEICLDPLTPEQVKQTQAGGLRHRRNGLAIRLKLAKVIGQWTPIKRVKPHWDRPAAIGTQLVRIAIRRVTSAPGVEPGSRAFNRQVALVMLAHRQIIRLQRWTAKR